MGTDDWTFVPVVYEPGALKLFVNSYEVVGPGLIRCLIHGEVPWETEGEYYLCRKCREENVSIIFGERG